MGSTRACPRLQQSTAIHLLSSVQTPDLIYFSPGIESGANVSLQCDLPAATATGTLSNVVAKNRSTPQLLNATLPGSLSAGMLIVNTTHPSRAWTYKLVSGSTWAISQPIVAASPPTLVNVPSEVDTWANGDSVSVYALTSVQIAELWPTWAQYSSNGTNHLVVYQCAIVDSAPGSSQLRVRTNTTGFYESSLARVVTEEVSLTGVPIRMQFYNIDFARSPREQNTDAVWGGQFRDATGIADLGAIFVTDDVIVGGGALGGLYQSQGGQYGPVYVDTGTSYVFEASSAGYSPAVVGPSAVIWGPGSVGVQGVSRLRYPAGAGAATATFLQTGGFTVNGQTKVCLDYPANTGARTCNLTLSPSQLDTSLGAAVTGCLYVPAGASVCNELP